MPQTQYNNIKHMNQVRYAQPRQGCSNPPANSIRLTGAGSLNFNNYRKQNSYRKGQQRSIRGESAKGARSSNVRNSIENSSGYKQAATSSDQNFIMHEGGSAQQDSEVANITQNNNAEAVDATNIVHLSDPKHI